MPLSDSPLIDLMIMRTIDFSHGIHAFESNQRNQSQLCLTSLANINFILAELNENTSEKCAREFRSRHHHKRRRWRIKRNAPVLIVVGMLLFSIYIFRGQTICFAHIFVLFLLFFGKSASERARGGTSRLDLTQNDLWEKNEGIIFSRSQRSSGFRLSCLFKSLSRS